MFAWAEVPLEMPIDTAKQALELAVADGGLIGESRRAISQGRAFVVAVGPRGSQGIAKEVVVRVVRGRSIGDSYLMALRWEVPGVAGKLFPALDANLALSALGPASSELRLLGSYRPPLGKFGGSLDRAALARVASATAKAFLNDVAAHLAKLAAAQTLDVVPDGDPPEAQARTTA